VDRRYEPTSALIGLRRHFVDRLADGGAHQ
jgi:hypothetical protein